MADWILTFDLGTTGNKCTLHQPMTGEMHGVVIPYDTQFPKPGWAEQNPADYWRSCLNGTRALLDAHAIDIKEICAISLSGTMNGCIPITREGEALYANIIHSDNRTARLCHELSRRVRPEDFYRVTGNRLDTHYTMPKILWFEREYPGLYKKTAWFSSTKDYVYAQLTGHPGLTDYSDASLMAMLDLTRRDWAVPMLEELGIDIDRLPQLAPSHFVDHTLSQEAARQLGLIAGIPVAVGGGDGACSARGAGVMQSPQGYSYIGSSAWISVMADGPLFDSQARNFNYMDLDGRHVHVTGTVQSAASAFDYMLDKLVGEELAYDDRFERIERLARQSPIGANGVLFSPYVMGERTPHWDERTRGALIGFTLFHSKSDMLRAVYEGVAYALTNTMDVLRENKLTPSELVFIGGGAKSALWDQMLADLYELPICLPENPSASTSLGAAMCAGVGIGLYESYAQAASTIARVKSYEPDARSTKEYQKNYKIYNLLYSRLKPIYDELSKLSENKGGDVT